MSADSQVEMIVQEFDFLCIEFPKAVNNGEVRRIFEISRRFLQLERDIERLRRLKQKENDKSTPP
ncbi:MAG TPA: hypothetical protein VMF08_10395 [Candidatus Sulfotelmatobacter sp.]|nr:hypothetical protein [Candidatus Sulfotelmatobacter sp.]